MSRLVLVHWNAPEAEARAETLRAAGHSVRCHSDPRANPHALAADLPDAFVIDLARLPSKGRELGGFLRRLPATRRVPLVFLEGDPAKTERVRALLPDATFATWERVADNLAHALTRQPEELVVPGAMDAYAGAPLARKLGVKACSTVLLLGAPRGFEETLGALPDSARALRAGSQPADIVLFFVRSPDGLASGFDRAATRVKSGGRLWILWPKRTGRANVGPTQNTVRALGLAREWVDYKVSAIDGAWSGLCFARRGTGRTR